MPQSLDKGSTDRFAYEWSTYTEIIPDYEEQFLKWVYPLQATDFQDRDILDAGCGIGRNSYWPLRYGARSATAFDYDTRTVEVARQNLSSYPNAKVTYQSIYDIDYANQFDISFSIGVIHHLEFPRKAIEALVKATKPGGKILIWVYGYETNEWIVNYINPLRRLTSKLPIEFTHALSNIFAALLYLRLRLIPSKHAYMQQISKFKFWHLRSIVFDQLLPHIAHYWTSQEALSLFDGLDISDIQAYPVNQNSWTILAIKNN